MWRNYFLISFILIQLSVVVDISAQVVAEFGKYEITLDEFEHAYAKNVGGWENAINKDLQEYKNF
ncbi:MAG: hypothetical protein M5T52_13060 [Ignavibacteriaceae bacterium]|nr:hypothetical protein [Ignavibacteriaceae bacterium]